MNDTVKENTPWVRGLLVWFVATLFVVYAFSLNTATPVFIHKINETMHISTSMALLPTASFLVVYALMQIPAGYLLDRYNPRIIISIGLFALSLGTLLISQAGNVYILCIANAIAGFGGAFSFVAAGLMIGQWFPGRFFPLLFGLTQTIACLGSGSVHIALINLLTHHSWESLYAWLGIVGFAITALALLFISGGPQASRDEVQPLLRSLKDTVKLPQVWLATVCGAVTTGSLYAYAGFWYLEVQHYYGVSNVNSIYVSSIIYAGIGIGAPLFGWLSNVVRSRIIILQITTVLGIIAMMAGIYLPHFNFVGLQLTYLISFLIGFCLSGGVLYYTVISELTPMRIRGMAISLGNLGVFLFYAILLYLPYSFTTSISFLTQIWLLPCAALSALILLCFIKETIENPRIPAASIR